MDCSEAAFFLSCLLHRLPPASLLLSRNKHSKRERSWITQIWLRIPEAQLGFPSAQWGLPVAARWPLCAAVLGTLVVLGAPVMSRVWEVPLRVANCQFFAAAASFLIPHSSFFFLCTTFAHKGPAALSSSSIEQKLHCLRAQFTHTPLSQ